MLTVLRGLLIKKDAYFEACGEEFERVEANNCEFSNGEYSFTCEDVKIEDFSVDVKNYDFEIDETDGSVRICGSAGVNYTVIGLFLDGDDDMHCGYVECGREDSGAEITFIIDVDYKKFSESDMMITIK